MPIYSIRDNNTNEEFEVNMKYSQLEEYLKQNPNFQQIFTKFPGVCDPVRVGRMKPDDGFRDVLREVKKNHRGNTINIP